jgi:hypothetical protein
MHHEKNMVDNIQYIIKDGDIGGPKGRPNNLQSAWRLAELFFQSDLS